jgi:hypothetical protein
MEKLTSPFDIIKKSWGIFTKRENLIYLIKIYSPIGFLAVISLAFTYVPLLTKFFETYSGNIVMSIFNFLFAILAIFINLSGIIAVTAIIGGQTPTIESIYKKALSKYLKFLLLTIVVYIIFALGIVLLIVPFILFMTWFAFSMFIYVERGTGIRASLSESKKLVKGRFWKIFVRISAFGLFSVLSQIVLSFLPLGMGTIAYYLIGGLFLLPQILLYKEVTSETSVNG